QYDVFPYPLEGLRGVLDIAVVPPELCDATAAVSPDRPPAFGQARRDHCLFRGLEAGPRGGGRAPSGQFGDRPDGDPLGVDSHGRELPLDAELAYALGAVKLTGAWEALAPRGRLNFNARVVNRYPPGAADGDLTLALSVAGPTIQPTFFPFEMANVA